VSSRKVEVIRELSIRICAKYGVGKEMRLASSLPMSGDVTARVGGVS
jgi:hypothetical protein